MNEGVSESVSRGELINMTADVAAAYVGQNPVSVSDLPNVIRSVYGALSELAAGAADPQPVKQEPAVSIRRSVAPDYLICLEDGKKLKMLKRYLRSRYGLTPEEYREKWGLAADYPMVAPNYAKQRSEFAKSIGLGRQGRGRRRS